MSNGSSTNGSSGAMKPAYAAWLAAYLVLSTVVSGYAVYSLWSLHCPKNAPCAAQQSPSGSNPGSQPSTTTPTTSNAGTQATTPQAGTKPSQQSQGATSTTSSSAPQGAAGAGSPAQSAGQQTAPAPAPQPSQNPNPQPAPAQTSVQQSKNDPIYDWTFFGIGPGEITGESRLLLLVLFMGMFGSAVYSLKSLGDYRGENKLMRSWLLFYAIQPFEGSGIALLMYLVVRGGFLSAANTNSDSINIFGICAIAGLAGAFSDTAFMKLNEVFNSLFNPKDNRGGKIDALSISTLSPLPDAKVGVAYSVTLHADNATGATTWSVTPALPAGLSLGTATGVVIGTPSTAQAATDYVFTVKDSANPPSTTKKTLSLTIH